MSEAPAPSPPPPPSGSRLIFTLAGIALFSGVLLSLTYEFTKPLIQRNESEALQAAIFEVLEGAASFQAHRLEDATLTPLDGEATARANVYEGLDAEGRRVGFALSGEARGYADVIRILYGYDAERERVIGMKVLSSNETPGLGDKIMKDSAFLLNFVDLDAALAGDGLALEHEIVTVKHGEKENPWEIDGISGATVSSTAVGKALRTSTNRLIPELRRALDAGEGTE